MDLQAASLVCELEYDRTVNYAIQQNHVPVVKRLHLSNTTGEDMEGLIVTLSAEPAFAVPWVRRVDRIPAGETIDVGTVDLELCAPFLRTLSERVAGSLNLKVTRNDEPVYSRTAPIEVLACDEWNGAQTVPEIIAAFITPNLPAIGHLLQRASEIMGQWTGDPSLDGYQSRDPGRVRSQLGAFFAAIRKEEIAYCTPPASFEEHGQRIRLPDSILGNRLATCLDLTVLFAACAEAAGLRPLVLFFKGHALPGAWLVDESFPESAQDDVTLITRRIPAGVQEICVIESTAMASGQNAAFDDAVRMAESKLREPDQFLFFVDVRRARASQIRPIPIFSGADGDPEIGRATVVSSGTMGAPGAASRPLEFPDAPDGGRSLSRTEQWERRLLDLSLRNPLLNYRTTARSLRLLHPGAAALEDAAADGRELQVFPRPIEWASSPREPSVYRLREGGAPVDDLLKAELAQRRLRADLDEKELPPRLTQLYRSSRISLEETGANALYLALGILLWYEDDRSQKPRRAPILLVPMEVVRRSVQSGYAFRIREDEPQVNITLMEMLHQDFGIDVPGLDPLPMDENGVDVERVLALFRHAIMPRPRWDVLDDAYLGLFSFSKFVMWRDIKARAADLQRSKIVAGLVAGQMLEPPPDNLAPPSSLDGAYAPSEFLCPISADSSQLAAIAAASRGRSFVLHGPPGTGKSQTITNIIANELGRGKTVLFVAEKMAALSVVQRRLEQMGLGPFCLELHSNKSRKRDVLDQLEHALKAAGEQSPAQWSAEADRLARLRDDLNGYASALHRERPSGFTLFEAISRLAAIKKETPLVRFDTSEMAALTGVQFQAGRELARQIQVLGENCGGPHNHPWALSARQDYSLSLRGEVAESLTRFRQAVERWREAVPPVNERLKISEGEPGYRELCALEAVVTLWKNGSPPPTLLRARDWDEVRRLVKKVVIHGRSRDALRKEVFERYQPQVTTLDAASLAESLGVTEAQWLLPRFLGRRRTTAVLRRFLLHGAPIDAARIHEDLARIVRLREEIEAIASISDHAGELFGPVWRDGEVDWDELPAAVQRADEMRRIAAAVAGADSDRAAALLEQWAQVSEACAAEALLNPSEDRSTPQAPAPPIAAHASPFSLEDVIPDAVSSSSAKSASEGSARTGVETEFRSCAAAGDAVIAAWQEIRTLLALEDAGLTGSSITTNPVSADYDSINSQNSGWFPSMLGRIDSWEKSLDALRDWCAWRRARSEAAAAGLSPLIDAYEQGQLSHEALEGAYEQGIYTSWLEVEISRDPTLASFQRVLFEDRIRQFRESDEAFMKLTRQELFARLAARIPEGFGSAAPHSEVGILKREMLKQRNHMALRALIGKIPNLLSRLKPCLLMSPMSVAQYLDPAHPSFDLVVFDEASQVPTCDAVGALARGSEAVIVGDPKQLPPTSFFDTGSPDEELEAGSVQDLQSILDDVLAISLPEEHLRWHYRSQHEGLIAFSNRMYYQNGLLTFPSPNELQPVVTFRPVDGVYDRGGTRQNQAEAEAVVAEVVRRLNDPALRRQSIGIVTFSSPQQRLVEDLLDEQLQQDPALEGYLSHEMVEPVFVKNLENVQGDERDVILFSIGYGPDAAGRVSMNFGPLNQQGGPRRLNVAVTRARLEMMVFSALRADHLDLSRTTAAGVAHLKAFLEYAERGRLPLDSETAALSAGHEPGLEREIALALQQRGHTAHSRVGSSGYRLDLAVLDPAHPGRYLLGIETDGVMYHQAKTARDRDKLRQMVLEELGWKLHRVWAVEWWADPARELRRIEDAIEAARTSIPAGSPSMLITAPVSPAPPPVDASSNRVGAESTSGDAGETAGPFASRMSTPGPPPSAFLSPNPVPGAPATSADMQGTAGSSQLSTPYRQYHLPPRIGEQEDFYKLSTTLILASQIEQVVREEGPISIGLLSQRLARAWGMTRVSSRVEARIQDVFRQVRPVTTQVGGSIWLWPRGMNPEDYSGYRTPGKDPDERRGPQDLPPQEIANAIADVVRRQVSLPESDLVREVAHLFGFHRTGAALDAAIRQGLDMALRGGKIHRAADGRIISG
ncbi:MAG TPA: DUF3320 domain-containing protein [Armatimonadota bacterium]|nr:DUF3320 domain-containing protein [Armatimonadota bacterium]